jgi:hypothetical protein
MACTTDFSTLDLRGEWGGEHIALSVAADSAALEYDCATGAMTEPIKPTASGSFTAIGYYIPGQGGPARQEDVGQRLPAEYTGTTDADDMTLAVTLTETGQAVGFYTLFRNEPPTLFKCLVAE